jgi:predicted dehydrogenase
LKKRYGAGVIGVGIRGEQHAWIFSKLPETELIAVCDVSAERARAVADRYGAKHWFTDYNDLVRSSDIDIVTIATPDFAHKEPAVAAAEQGKHLIVEKPMATTVRDAQDIVRAAKKAGVKLMPFFHKRWYLPYVAVKEAIDRGDLGTPLYIYYRTNDTITFPTKMISWAAKSGIESTLMVLHADIARWLLASEARSVYAIERSRVLKSHGIETSDFMVAIVEFKNGAVANFEVFWILPESLSLSGIPMMELIGTRGCVLLDMYHTGVEAYLSDKHVHLDGLLGAPSLYGEPFGAPSEAIRHFVTCVARDSQPMVSGEDGVRNTEIVCAARRSATEGRPITLS